MRKLLFKPGEKVLYEDVEYTIKDAFEGGGKIQYRLREKQGFYDEKKLVSNERETEENSTFNF